MLKITGLSYHIGQNTILDNIHLTIKDAKITALIGPNGAGKSSLLSCIARLEPISPGKIWLNDYDIAKTSSRIIAQHLAILTQHNSINSRITVKDLLMFGRYPHHQGQIRCEDHQVVQDALVKFELEAFSERYLSELSGGQRQRALIAMIFCQQTSHILLDEPLNNLDMLHVKSLMKILRKMTDELHLTIVIVVHDINIAAAYADQIVAMKEGKILMEGAPEEIITPLNLQRIFNLDTEVLKYKGKPLVVGHI